jgi:hypothetical protein
MSRESAFLEIEKLERWNSKKVSDMWDLVNGVFKDTIASEEDLRKAQRRLFKAWDEALVEVNYEPLLFEKTVDVIIANSYVEPVLLTTKPDYEKRMLRTNLFTDVANDKRVLSTKIRDNNIEIVKAQKAILKKGLNEGRTVANIARDINKNANFPEKLPNFLEDLRKKRVLGESVSPAEIKRVRNQVSKIKTPRLRKNYENLIDAINLNEKVDQAATKAIAARTNYLSTNLTQSEVINAINDVKNQRAVDRGMTHIKSLPSGPRTCNQCQAIANEGYLPMESASIATHHTRCYCNNTYEFRVEKAKPITQERYTKSVQAEIDRLNEISKKEGRKITHNKPPKIQNLKEETIRQKLGIAA